MHVASVGKEASSQNIPFRYFKNIQADLKLNLDASFMMYPAAMKAPAICEQSIPGFQFLLLGFR